MKHLLSKVELISTGNTMQDFHYKSPVTQKFLDNYNTIDKIDRYICFRTYII